MGSVIAGVVLLLIGLAVLVGARQARTVTVPLSSGEGKRKVTAEADGEHDDHVAEPATVSLPLRRGLQWTGVALIVLAVIVVGAAGPPAAIWMPASTSRRRGTR